MNYSLPVVAAQYVQPGTITAKIRGTGTVEAGDPYNVELTQSRVIQSVAVKNGDKVEKDQVLFYLEDAESEELKTAEAELKKAILDYEIAILSGDISNKVVTNAQSGVSATVADYQARITAAENTVKAAQSNLDSLNAQVTEIDRQLAILGYTNVDVTAETNAAYQAEQKLTNAQGELTAANASLSSLQNDKTAAEKVIFEYESGITVSGGDETIANEQKAAYDSAKAAVVALPAKIETAKTVVNDKQAAVRVAQDAKTKADAALKAKQDSSGTTNDLNIKKTNLSAQVATATAALKSATDAKEQLISDISAEINLGAQNEAIAEKQAEVAELREKSVGAEVTAPVAGTVTSLGYVAGETTSPDKPLAVLQPEGKGYSLSFSVTTEQARRVTVGDPADIQNSWYYSELSATLASIKNDPENPGKNKLLVFDIQGEEVTNGQSLSLSVGQKSADYDMIVPNSAVREDSNGKFILIVESKSSPLGNRYVATRVDVEVLASDDTQSAISGALYGYEFVVTTSTKPVEAGKLVRLADQ